MVTWFPIYKGQRTQWPIYISGSFHSFHWYSCSHSMLDFKAVSLPQPISFFIWFEVHFTHSVVYGEATFGVLRQGDLKVFMKPVPKISSRLFAFSCTILPLCCILRQCQSHNCLHPQHCAIFSANVSIRSHWKARAASLVPEVYDFVASRFWSLLLHCHV